MSSGSKTTTRSADPKIEKIQAELDATKKIMEKNIDKMLERGEKLEALKNKTEQLKTESQAFNQNAVKLKQELQFKNVSLTIVLIGTAIGAVIGLYGVLAAGYAWICLPLSSALGASLSYILTKPLSSLFHLYQKTHYGDPLAVNHSRIQKEEIAQRGEVVPVKTRLFQPQFQGRKESNQEKMIEEGVTIKPLRNGVKAL
jgi:hypothetical protein